MVEKVLAKGVRVLATINTGPCWGAGGPERSSFARSDSSKPYCGPLDIDGLQLIFIPRLCCVVFCGSQGSARTDAVPNNRAGATQ